MATIASNCLPASFSPPADLSTGCTLHRRRSWLHAAQAKRTLGHAIEYLTDEFVMANEPSTVNKAQLDAVKLLMVLNRQVFMESQELPTLGARFRAALHLT